MKIEDLEKIQNELEKVSGFNFFKSLVVGQILNKIDFIETEEEVQEFLSNLSEEKINNIVNRIYDDDYMWSTIDNSINESMDYEI